VSIFSPAEMAGFRALPAALGALADSYAIRRDTVTADSEGGQTTTMATVEAGSCLLTTGAVRPEERRLAERAGATAPFVVKLPYDTGLRPSDVLVVNDRTLEILGVLRGGALGVVVTAICEERS